MFQPSRLFCSLLVLVLVCGCGGDDAGAPGDPPASTDSQSSAGTAPAVAQEDRGSSGDRGKSGKDKPDNSAASAEMQQKFKGFSVSSGNAGTPDAENAGGAATEAASGPAALMAALAAAVPGLSQQMAAPGVFPDNVSLWTDQHLEAGVRQRRLKVGEAILRRAQTAPATPAFAQLMSRLLAASLEPVLPQPPPPTPEPQTAAAGPAAPVKVRLGRGRDDDDRGSRRERIDRERAENRARASTARNKKNGANSVAAGPVIGEAELVQSIVQALVRNDTNECWQLLKDILSGKQSTMVANPQLARIVFQSIFSGEPLNAAQAEDLLRSIVADESADATAVAGVNSIADLVMKYELMQPVDSNASDSLAGASQSGVAAVGPGFSFRREADDDQPRNRSRGGGDKRNRRSEDGRSRRRPGGNTRAGTGSVAPAGAAVPGGVAASPASIPRMELQLTRNQVAAAQPILRADGFIDAAVTRAAAVQDQTQAIALLTLASALPHVDVRHILFQQFEQRYTEGVADLLAAGLYGEQIRDPGHLLVLKALPRPRARKAAPGAAAAPPDPRLTWSEATWTVVSALTEQLRDISSRSELNWDGLQMIRPFGDAIPQVSIVLTIPDGSGEAGSGGGDSVSGTRVFYSRYTLTPQNAVETRKIASHYESRTRGARRERVADGVLWFDGGRSKDGIRESLDVLIRDASLLPELQPAAPVAGAIGGGRGAPAGGPVFVVEAVAVVAKDPRVASPGSRADGESAATAEDAP